MKGFNEIRMHVGEPPDFTPLRSTAVSPSRRSGAAQWEVPCVTGRDATALQRRSAAGVRASPLAPAPRLRILIAQLSHRAEDPDRMGGHQTPLDTLWARC